MILFNIVFVINIFACSSADRTEYINNLTTAYPGYGTHFLFFPGNDGELRKGYLELNRLPRINFISIEDIEALVSIKYYSRKYFNGVLIDRRTKLYEVFDYKKPTKLITHGWMSNGETSTCLSIKDNYLQLYDVNIFVLDWGKIADNIMYPVAAESTPKVGQYYSEFLNYLVNNLQANPTDLHLIGHSLGAHVSGFAARRVKRGKVGRITGLDPALPGFKTLKLVYGGRLDKEDAIFVDVIHTCIGVLGLEAAIGHVDFYPNGGNPPQPGCANILEILEACSHGRSWQYFSNSIIETQPYWAYHCPSYEDFVFGRNCFGNAIPMGDPVPKTARGVYYLRTNLTWPVVAK